MSSTILTIAGLLVGAAGIVARIFFLRSGVRKERLKNAEKELEAVDEGKKIDNEVDVMPDGDALGELRDKWSRG